MSQSIDIITTGAGFFIFTICFYAKFYIVKDKQHDSKLTGNMYYEEILTSANKINKIQTIPNP